MFDTSWLADLDAEAACVAVTESQARLRQEEWRELCLAAHWAVLHDRHTAGRGAHDPHDAGPDQDPRRQRSRRVGGDGTPLVAEFAAAELGALMGRSTGSAAALMRDAVDLQHRHPRLWALLATGAGRVWKARKVAAWCHAADLALEQAWAVDAATTDYLDSLPWADVERLVRAKIIAADPEAAEARRREQELAQFVATGRTSEHGLATLVARADAGDVLALVAMSDRIATVLAEQGDASPVDVRRARALGILANPAAAYSLLAAHSPGPDPVDEACRTCGRSAVPAPVDPERVRPRAVLVVRVSQAALESGRGAAVCLSGGVGAITLQKMWELLGHRQVTVRPVLDPDRLDPVDGPVVPGSMLVALAALRPSSVFPWSTTGGRLSAAATGLHGGTDVDHTEPYRPLDSGGRPGQTRLANLGPLTRHAHRLKTHAPGWLHLQPLPGVYLWRTPHRWWFHVDATGTYPLGRDPDLSAYGLDPPGADPGASAGP